MGNKVWLDSYPPGVGGGASLQKPVAERWHKITGNFLTEAYGLTESSLGVCCTLIGTPRNGSVSLPVSSTEVSIRDEAFNELPLWNGEGDIARHTGEICVFGPQVMRGYWNNAVKPRRSLNTAGLKQVMSATGTRRVSSPSPTARRT